jgi:nucleotide-binding universal stress UspA family protein
MAQPPVIVGVDDAPDMAEVVNWAADEARRRQTRLHLVHAWLPQPFDTPDAAANPADRQAAEKLVAGLAELAATRQPGLEVSSGIVETGPREALESLSRTAGLLVLGRRGSGGFPGLLAGSTSQHLAASAACPVVVVPAAPGPEASGGVAVGLRGKDAAEAVLTQAFEAAQRLRAPLRVVHAWRNPLLLSRGHALPPVYEAGQIADEQTRLLAEILAGWRQRYPDVPVETDTVRSGPAKRLVEVSATQRLLVVGRHGNVAGLVGRLGSVSQAVVHHAACPVEVVPMG